MKRQRLRSRCPIAGALDLVGDRWTLLVLSETPPHSRSPTDPGRSDRRGRRSASVPSQRRARRRAAGRRAEARVERLWTQRLRSRPSRGISWWSPSYEARAICVRLLASCYKDYEAISRLCLLALPASTLPRDSR